MKKGIIIALCCFATLGTWGQKTKKITVLHTNDTHSNITPFNPNASDTANANKARFLRRAAMLRDLRNENKNGLPCDR